MNLYSLTSLEVADYLGLYYSTISVIAKRVADTKKHQDRRPAPEDISGELPNAEKLAESVV